MDMKRLEEAGREWREMVARGEDPDEAARTIDASLGITPPPAPIGCRVEVYDDVD